MTRPEILQTFVTKLMAGESDEAFALLHPAFVINEAESLPYPGDHHGAEGFQRLFATVNEAFELTIHGSEFLDAGSAVIVKADTTIKSRATGDEIRMPIVEIYYFSDDDLISSGDVYYKDTKAVADLYAAGVSA